MPISITQGKELVFKTRNGQKVNLEMGRAYFIEDPNDNEGPLAQVCPPQLTTILCIPIGVDKNKEYMVRFLFVGVDSKEYTFNKRDDYSIHVMSRGHTVILNYESLLDVFERIDIDRGGRNVISYMGTHIAVNPWITNIKKFQSLEPTEIRLFDASRIPRKFLKYFFGYPHHNIEATKRSKFPMYEEVTRGISPRLDTIQKKRIMLENFHKLFAMLNVNNNAKLVNDAVPYPLLSIIPFVRKNQPRIQEVVLSLKSPGIMCTQGDGVITLRIAITEEEFDQIGRSADIFNKCGVVFHIKDKQYATVPLDVYEGNPQYRIDGVSNIKISAFNVKRPDGVAISYLNGLNISHYVLDGTDHQVRQYIHNMKEAWDESGRPAVRDDQIIDISNGDGYNVWEACEMADLNGERRLQLQREELHERLAVDGAGEEDGYEDEEEDYPEDAAEVQEVSELPQLMNIDAPAVSAGGMVWGEAGWWNNQAALQNPGNVDLGEVDVVRGEMRVLDNCRVVSYDLDYNGMTMQGSPRVPEDDPGIPFIRESLMGNSQGRMVPGTVFTANFSMVWNTVRVAREHAIFRMHVTPVWAPVVENVGRNFPTCIFKFFNVETAVFNNRTVYVDPDRGGGEMFFMLIPENIEEDHNIQRSVEEIGGEWMGPVQIVFDYQRRQSILMGAAVLLPRAHQLKADLVNIVRTARILQGLYHPADDER